MDRSKDVTLKDTSATLPSSSYVSPDRFSLPFHFRITVTTLGVSLAGMLLGASHGSRTAGLVFRAENSHRFPDTSAGWYLYHKSKNYQMMYGGVKEAFRMGSKVAFWAGGFFIVEEAIDRVRSRTDFMSTVVAGLGVAGGFSVWSECLHPMSSPQ